MGAAKRQTAAPPLQQGLSLLEHYAQHDVFCEDLSIYRSGAFNLQDEVGRPARDGTGSQEAELIKEMDLVSN